LRQNLKVAISISGKPYSNRIQFKGDLNTYRFCDNVWTFVLKNADFTDNMEKVKVDKVKIVACDGRNATMKDD
jgi:hypothetical protein